MFLSLTNSWQCVYRWHLILTKFSVFWQRTADADKQNCWKLHSFVRFVHSFVRLSSWCWQIKNFFLKIAQLCATFAQLCATLAQLCATWAQPCANITLLVKEIAQLCANITLLVIYKFLNTNAWYHRWWIFMSNDISPHEDCRWES